MLKFLSQLFSGGIAQMNIEQYMQAYYQQNNHVLIDVRTPAEFKSGHVNKAKNMPLNSIAQQMASIPKDKTLVVMCKSGMRSAMAARQLSKAGYENVVNLKGGVTRWQALGHPLK